MKRKLFFWLEKLKVTPAERKAVSGLMVTLILLTTLNMTLSQSVPFEENQYRELEKQFEARTAVLREKEDELMKRYFPPKAGKRLVTTTADTTPSKTVQKTVVDSSDQKPAKQLININKADQQTLESLPGIGPAYAKRIISYRKKHDGFKSMNELIKIKGIGEKRLDNVKPFIKLTDSE